MATPARPIPVPQGAGPGADQTPATARLPENADGAVAGEAGDVARTPQAGDVIDLVGGMLDEVARRRAERRAAAENNPEAPPPRIGGGLLRGRLRRLAPGAAPTAPAAEPRQTP